MKKEISNADSLNQKLSPLVYEGKTIPIKQIIDLNIHLTYDMSIFGKCPYNRNRNPKNIKTILLSVLIHGWIIPIIIVNKKMQILLGQHLVEVATVLGAPIYYIVAEDLTPEELVALEIAMRWTDRDALETYATIGNNVARGILNLYNEINISLSNEKKIYKKLSIPQFLAILYQNTDYIKGLRANGGITLINNLPQYNIKKTNLLKIAKIFSYAQKNCMPRGVTIRRQYVTVGIVKFIFDNIDNLDLDRLYNKLSDFRFDVGSSPVSYVKQLECHYN